MKKSLLALAAMGAFAGAAQAQSSVTVYGVMDASYTSIEASQTAVGATSATTQKVRNTVNGDGALSKAEAEAAKMQRLVRDFDKLDKNKDGKLTADEMAAAPHHKMTPQP